MGRTFFTPLLQIKYAILDNPNNIGLTVSPKKRFPQVEQKWTSRHVKLTENCKKACVVLQFC